MSALTVTIDLQLARTVRFTQRLRERTARHWAVLASLIQLIDFIARGTYHVYRNRRYFTAHKLINIALVNLQFKLKTETVIGRPYKMKIESTNICNTKCQLCPTGIGLEGRPKGRMSFEQYRSLVDQFKRDLVALDLSMWGDPLIVPDIYRMIRYAHDQGIWTYLSSNLHAFKPGKGQARQLVESGLDLLTCSLHGASQATYEAYQPGKSFEDAVAKVREIIAERDALGSRTPHVQLNFVVTRANEHEIASFQQLADELGCKAVFSTAALNTRFLDKDRKLVSLGMAEDVKRKVTREHLERWLPRDRSYVLEAYQQMLDGAFDPAAFNGKKLYDCSWPWRQSIINWDGTVATCCGSFGTGEDMGNVLDTPFARIWNGPKYRAARRSFKHKLDAQQAKDNPCATCPGFMV